VIWDDLIAGLTFAGIVMLLFLAGHYVGVLMYWLDRREPELTPEQEAMIATLLEQPK
jgi:hypothetical protein